MQQITRSIGLAAFTGLLLAGCAAGGSSTTSSSVPTDATPLTTSEMYMYFMEKTQAREGGGVYFTEIGTLYKLEGDERIEGTWASYDGGKLCIEIEGRADECEMYYRTADGISVVRGDQVAMAPELMKGNQLDLLATGTERRMYTPEQTTALVSGKTAVWENNNGAYYAPDGTLMTLWEGTKEAGKWSVDDKGGICWHVPSWGKTPCEYYFEGPDGLTAVYQGEESPAVEHRDGDQLDSL